MAHTHVLKIDPEWYNRVREGAKRAEVRKHDRDFQTGDLLTLLEWNSDHKKATGRLLYAKVTHVLAAVDGIDPGYCVLSVQIEGER